MARSAFLTEEKVRPSVEDSYSYCENIVKSSSTSFARSFKSLPVEKRNAVNALYAFCRRVDDIVDGDWLPVISTDNELDLQSEMKIIKLKKIFGASKEFSDLELKKRVKALLWFSNRLDTLESSPKSLKDPIFIALADSIEKFPINLDNLRELILGMEEDLFHIGYQTYEERRIQ